MIKGGFTSLRYSFRVAWRVGFINLIKVAFSKNTCKPCAFGMGGQKGGMVDETGSFPEVCKKSFQAQLTEIQKPIPKDFFSKSDIEHLGSMSSQQLEQSGRLTLPLYKANDSKHYKAVTWDFSINHIAEQLRRTTPERSFFYASGRSSNEAGFLFQLTARLYGCFNINNVAYYCHQPSGVGLKSVIGSGTATVRLADLYNADLIFVIGANPASNHPRFMKHLLGCRRRGGKVIVVNPVKEPGLMNFAVPSDIKSLMFGGHKVATNFVQVRIGGDVALLKGIAKVIMESGKEDKDFIELHTKGFETWRKDIEVTSWDLIMSASGVSKEMIYEIGELYGNSNKAIFAWALGITQHKNGTENVESIANLAMLRGMIGKRSAGLLPLRGHSNIQGIGTMGVTPSLGDQVIEKMNNFFGTSIPNNKGMDTLSCIKAADQNEIDFAFLKGGNIYEASPDTSFARRALNKISNKVFLSTTLNKGHFQGVDGEVFILPVKARDEEQQKTTQESMFNYVRLSDGGVSRFNNTRSEVEIIADIAARLLPDSAVNFHELKDHNKLRNAIGNIIPGHEHLLKNNAGNKEFHIVGRTFYEPLFSTPDKKAIFKVCTISNPENSEYTLMSVRSEGQFNTTVFDEYDSFRNQVSRRVVLMNKSDIKREGIKIGEQVKVESRIGKLENIQVMPFDICAGNVLMYYPEANAIIPADFDERSMIPAYKSVRVRISK